MKNLKFIVASAILVCCGCAVHGEALYWMVDTTNPGFNGYTGSDVAYAVLNVIPASDATPGQAVTPGSGTAIDALAVNGTTAAPTLADLGSYTSSQYSFFVELFNASDQSIYTQHAVNYNDLVSSGYVSTGGINVPSVLATGGFNGASVPEPTSGVLMLIGASLLALRRRKLA